MSVVATIITRAATAHATDSLITQEQGDGKLEPKSWRAPKLVPVEALRGAMAYWGLAANGPGWSTLEWLRKAAGRARRGDAPESFANQLAHDLGHEIGRLQVPRDRRSGIGIHFTAYELVKNQWVPELFLITNWTDPSYTRVFPDGLRVTRETFATVTGIPKELCNADECQRFVVRQFLQAGRLLMFNNGDPLLFNPAASAVMQMYQTLASRGVLESLDDPATSKALALKAIKLVSDVQAQFCKKGTRRVGGRLHGLCVTPEGKYI